MPWSSHHVKGTYCQHDSPPLLMTLIAAVAGFVHCEVTLSPTFHTVLSGRKPLCTASSRGVGSHGDIKTISQVLSLLWLGPCDDFSCPWNKADHTTSSLPSPSLTTLQPHRPPVFLPNMPTLSPPPARARLSPLHSLPLSPVLAGFFSLSSNVTSLGGSRTNSGRNPEPQKGSPKPFLSPRAFATPHSQTAVSVVAI